MCDYISNMEQALQKILVFGGTVFIGKSFLNYLKNNNLKYQIHCLNRGTPYWNDALKKEHPEVIHHFFDRNDSKTSRKILRDLNENLKNSNQNKWKAVVDFSLYEQKQQEILIQLEGLVQKYIMISTDSVYNNSTHQNSPVKEVDFDLQTQFSKIQESGNIMDDYGFKKMKCQINLSNMMLKPYICLRLPDVIGQFDNFAGSQRYWCTLTSIKESQKHPIPITPKFRQKKLSFVDSQDVAHTINCLISSENIPPHHAYNMCFQQTVTLYEFYELISEAIQIKAHYQTSEEKVDLFFPSVQFGTIDCSLAKEQINWKPTPIVESIRRISKFYLQQACKYQDQEQHMKQQFSRFLSKYKLNN